MAHPLMPKATAVWLIDNTVLTFEQIAEFCGLHDLEIQALADGDVAPGMQGLDPVTRGEVTMDEIERCQSNPSAKLEMAKVINQGRKPRPKGARYTPVSKRGDRPNAIAWLLKNYPELTHAQISKLIGTTKPTINAIRDRSHWNTPNIKPQNPVGLGLCSGTDLEKIISVARVRAGKEDFPGAATAPDGVLSPQEIESPTSKARNYNQSPTSVTDETPASASDKELSVESVFGSPPNPSKADTNPGSQSQ